MMYAIFAVVGYLIGSLNFSIIIGKIFYKIDVREHGSKNAGATNTLRTLGKLPAIIVLILDSTKGILAFLITHAITKDNLTSYIAGTSASAGHSFPVFFGFRGGKGVITSIGTIFCINPILAAIILVAAVSVIAISKYVSLGAVFGAVLAVILFSIFDNTPEKLILIIIIAVLVIYRHRTNIGRLLKGTESKITFK